MEAEELSEVGHMILEEQVWPARAESEGTSKTTSLVKGIEAARRAGDTLTKESRHRGRRICRT